MVSLKHPDRPTPPEKKEKCNQPDLQLEEGACVSCAKQPLKDNDVIGCVWCDEVQH